MANSRPPAGLTGLALLNNSQYNKSTAFTEDERERFKLRGLLPAAVSSQRLQTELIMENLRRKAYDIERYILLMALQQRNERLFYRVLLEYIEEIMPLVYTPTVGQACREFAHIFRQPRGFYITPTDRGDIFDILDNWPERDVRMIVVTDGERILGLGDLGANGMGIPIGKLALYTAFAGIPPAQCLPVMLDVGTDNQMLREDPLYLGTRQPRLRGADYLALVDEFVAAVQLRYPRALIQFEDFLTPNAYTLLNRYRNKALCFNDDIQGTAAVALAGVFAACRTTGKAFETLKILFLGAGSAATGIGDLVQFALVAAGLTPDQARKRLWFADVDGLLVAGREGLAPHNRPYAHDASPAGVIEAIERIKPQVLIGATGSPGAFGERIIRTMASINERPVIFALSNPTERAECSAEQAYRWSEGRALFASGSPFAPVLMNGKTLKPGQGNNAYIFPGIGLGALACQATRISDEMFLKAAEVLADSVADDDLRQGSLYPPLSQLREVSLKIAAAVAEVAYRQGLAKAADRDIRIETIRAMMYDPVY
ncbi:NAD-dependent malic enzyme [Methylomarinum sp. Ch1-1]|uniref:NAD-dependent malic enzyme n=1 Tax=Methylomarinum roseum TaxID=3067653 RepID=A0AAU7NQY2_9GAMM|nr:NAD-dependent malic enzyme [Methylomarinum sp. Ch1-1]MDP4520685.1 NAD-dependent malic enzyme [Methylomarinum sp. Ch1-1]